MGSLNNNDNNQQISWEKNITNNYPENDYKASNCGNNWDSSNYKNMNNIQGSFTDTSQYNEYPQNNYSSSNYQKNNYTQSSYGNSNYNQAYSSANNSFASSRYNDNRPYERKLHSYREPGDPETAEIIWAGDNKISRMRTTFMIIVAVYAMVSGLLALILPKSAFTEFLLSLLLIMIGGFWSFYGITGFINTFIIPKQKKARCTYPITAKIIDFYERESNKGKISYYSIYKYFYADKIYLFKSRASCNNYNAIGKTIKIFINPNNPREYYRSCKYDYVSAFLGGIAGVFIAVFMLHVIVNNL
ncbi:MAG: DUF3592 domain-containing protein [Acutalibacteraceae bacterium]|nr:DUF3592 domain-containing protein [Acutalibacteraceae bacterium]